MKTKLLTAILASAFSAILCAQSPSTAPDAPDAPDAPPTGVSVPVVPLPREVLPVAMDALRPHTKLLLNGFSGLGVDSATLVKWLGEPLPENACDLGAWAAQMPGGVMPASWDASSRRYKVSREAWAAASPAIQRFTWHYLRAYGALDPGLRGTHSAVAVGVAANIAAAIVYPENFATMPDDVVGPASIVIALHAADPSFFAKARSGGVAAATSAVIAAFDKLCAVGSSQETLNIHRQPELLVREAWDRAIDGGAITLAHILPGHPTAQQRLTEQAATLPNLTLRATLEAALCIARYTVLPSPEARDRWLKQLADTRQALEAELAVRRARHIAPPFDTTKAEITSADPAILRPIAVMVGAIIGQEMFAAYAEKGADAAREVLFKSPGFTDMSALAGQEPQVTILLKPEVRSESVVLGTMTFRDMVRIPVTSGTPVPEKLVIDLIAIIPSGDADPIRGFDAQAFVLVKDPGSDTPRWVRGEEVITGMKILSHIPLGDPQTGSTVRLPGKMAGAPPSVVRESWCTVTEVKIHNDVKGTMVLTHEKGWSVAVAVPQHILINAAGTGIWVPATDLDSGIQSWAGEKRVADTLRTVTEDKTPRRLVDLALTHDEDELAPMANNCVIARDAQGSEAISVECRSGDTSLVAEDEEILIPAGRVALKDVVPNEKLDPAMTEATVVSAWWERPSDAVWEYPDFTTGEAWVSQKASVKLVRAVKLQLEEANGVTRPFMCSPLTKLVLATDKGVISRRRARNAKPGELLVAGFAQDGKTPQTVKVASVEEVELPQQRFVALELTNLKLAKAGPVLIEWHASQCHTFNKGVSMSTMLSLAAPAGAKAPADAGEAAASVFKITGTAAVKDSSGKPLAVFDPALDVIAVGGLGQVGTSAITRELVIIAGGHQLAVAGSQALLAVRMTATAENAVVKTSRDVVLAYQLHPEDLIFMAKDGDTKAVPVKIDSVVPRFKVATPVAELVAASAETWHDKLAACSDTCIANSMAIIMAAPRGGKGKGTGINAAPGTTPGPWSGDFKGNNSGTSARLQELGGGYQPKLDPNSPDRLGLPDQAVQQLKARANLIKQKFAGERGSLQSVAHSGLPARLEAKLQPGNWPFGKSGEDLANTLSGWISQALQRRAVYLEAPTVSDVPALCLQNIVLAAWLNAAGAKESANLFARDAVDFGLYAGFSMQAMSNAKMPAELGLGQVLAASQSAASGAGDKRAYAVNPHVSRFISDWANGLKAFLADGQQITIEAPVPKDGMVELDQVFALWAMRGELNDINWPDAPGSDFDRWLETHKPAEAKPAH